MSTIPFGATLVAAVAGLVVDGAYVANAHSLYSRSQRLIPWGSTYEEILGFTFLSSVVVLLLGLTIALRNLPATRSLAVVLISVICLTIHAATVFYARHILLSFAVLPL